MSLTFEEKVLLYFDYKEQRKGAKEQMDMLAEEIEQHFNVSAEDGELVMQLPNGEYAVLERKGQVKEEFDRDTLAMELLVEKDALNDPHEIAVLVQAGKLTPEMIEEHTHNQVEERLKLKKRKTKPKPKKKG